MNYLPSLPPLPVSMPYTRQPEWSLDQLVHRVCPACTADEYVPICMRPDRLVVGKCFNCGLYYVPDIPFHSDIEHLYSRYSNFKYRVPGAQRGSVLRKPLARIRLLRKAKRDFYIKVLSTSGGLSNQRLLEVGSSFGKFLSMAHILGAQVAGVETDQLAREYVRMHLNFCCFNQIDAYAGQADIACAFQVIEHLAAPLTMLHALREKVHTDARLLLAMPNGSAADQVGATWIGFRVDLEHLNYFTPTSISLLLARAGFWVEQVWEHKQASTFRPSTPVTNKPGWLRRKMNRLVTDIVAIGCGTQGDGEVWMQGAFNLTVLARAGERLPA